MQLFLLALILGLFLHDSPLRPESPMAGPAGLIALLIVPKAALALLYGAGCWLTRRRLGQRPGRAGLELRRLEWLTMLHRVALLGLYGLDLWAGTLVLVRETVGDWVLIDELLILTPPLAVVVFAWWAYYPIDRRLREAQLMQRIDDGGPVYPIWSRGQFILAQLRHQMALLMVPLLLVLAWIETVALLGRAELWALSLSAQMAMTLGGAAGIFLLTPVIIRHVWDTIPLPSGEIRDRLVSMCHRHGVRVRELLLWRTYGGMINAAVMGLIGPLRYILLSDALLDQVERDQVEAVMAHELAHVRKRHMVWLLASAGGTLGVIEGVGRAMYAAGWFDMQRERAVAGQIGGALQAWPTAAQTGPWLEALLSPEGLIVTFIAAAALTWVAAFGWVSRRFERQADAFAAIHLSGSSDEPWYDDRGRVCIKPEAAETMIGALQQVAELNNVPPEKKSWRHGSIAWRQAHLRSLIGRPVDQLPIDAVMRRIKLASLAMVGLAIALYQMV